MSRQRRHVRRERRFHRPPQALGRGLLFSTPATAPVQAETPASRDAAKVDEPDAAARAETTHLLARKGLIYCSILLVCLLFLGLNFSHILAVCRLVAHSWPNSP